MSTLLGYGPYSNPPATDTDDTGLGSPVIETTLTASLQTVDIGGVSVHAEVFNGGIPGPTFRLNIGDSVVVRLINDLPYEIGIHWHGVELENYSDGTEVTQNGTPPAPLQVLGNGVPAGGTFLYKFKVPRAGLFWYHPHHENSMNRVFRGLYGMIIVTDPLEASLVGSVLPAAADTMQLVLSDITVCKAGGSNDASTYVDPTTIFPATDRPEWLSGATSQNGPTPVQLCELPGAKDDDGNAAAASYAAGDVPSIMGQGPPLVEGQTALTNGVNVGGRKGTPAAPGPLEAAAVTKDILSGQGLRLQIVNCAHLRYFRLRLTTEAGVKVNLVRIGGEGGLLDSAILEGGTLGTIPSAKATLFESGEILLPPATRADVVAAIPTGLPVNSVLTLWTRDYQRTGDSNPSNWARFPTVPVMHLKVTGAAGATYTIGAGTALRAPASMPPVETLGGPNATLLNPAAFMPVKTGNSNQDIQVTTLGNPRIDNVDPMPIMTAPDYTAAPHIASSRFAENGKILELTITNASSGHAHHPFHLHGFSFQPVRIDPWPSASPPVSGTYIWPYREFRDTIDLLPGYTLTIRVRLDDRPLADGATSGGALGRWLFHCHLFFHHERGMMSELVVTSANGNEKPDVSVGGSWAYAPIGGTAARQGRFFHPDSLQMTLTATKGTVIPAGLSPGGNWSWSYTSAPGDPASVEYVYIEATDTQGRKDQAVFRLQIGGTDAGSDKGDPHIRTVDGTRYDFQAAGEFTLLRDLEGMEIQVRQTPAITPPPIPDDYTGLTECVSLNTAAAARVGSNRISYQLWRESSRLLFFLDGKPADLPKGGMDVDGHRVSTFDAGGEVGIRIDYAHGPVVTITPHLWANYGIRYLDVEVANTNAEMGLMGRIPKGTWLPALPSGATLGPLPASLHDRYIALYKTFADAWRVTDATSMFSYLPGRSTDTFTDRDWPPQKPPCTKLKPGFQPPANPILKNIPIARAKQICKGVKFDDLHAACVFDVASTGDKSFAKGYLIAQELRLCGTAVQIVGDKPRTQPGELLVVTATVLPLTPGRPIPTGSVTFIIDGVPIKTKLDKRGRGRFKVADLNPGEHKIRATYSGGGKCQYHPSSSPNLLHTVTRENGGGYTVTKPGGDMMPMGDASTRGRGSNAGLLHKVAKTKKPSPPAHRARKKNH
jgi:FtsP/CotA-like multicopper oxidase with cupredoxin domain